MLNPPISSLNDTGVPFTKYFDLTRTSKTRFTDYVVIPTSLTFIAHDDLKLPPTLDFDSEQIISFSASTIQMLSNKDKTKLYPLPLATDQTHTLDLENIHKKRFNEFSFEKCVNFIKKERQFSPTFNVVGHGTPNGIGPLDPIAQISPEKFAEKMHNLFLKYDLVHLKKSPLKFVFHTCNSAYAEVTPGMPVTEILSKITHDSFIGRFYSAMLNLEYTNVTVTGYRGYYSSVISRSAASARLQDSFFDPTFDCDLSQGEYTINKGICTSQCHEKYMTFPVQILSDSAFPEILAQKLSQLKL